MVDEPTDPPEHRGCTCEYCKCKLTRTGEVLEMSERARALRTLEDRLQDAERALTKATADLAAANEKIATLERERAPEPEQKKHWFTSDEI